MTTWKVSPGERKPTWDGGESITFKAYDGLGDSRTITVTVRHSASEPDMVTGREARRIAQRAVNELGDRETHIDVDPDDLPLDSDWWWAS